MKNTALLKTIAAFATAAALAFSCTDDSKDKESAPELVASEIIAESDTLFLDLDAFSPVDLMWTSGSWNGESIMTNRVVIDKLDGDFSAPVRILNPQYLVQSVTVTAEIANAVFDACKASDDATLSYAKWAVETSAGGNALLSKAYFLKLNRTGAVTPPSGGDDEEDEPVPFAVGMSLYMAGEGAAEAGQKLTPLHLHMFAVDANHGWYGDQFPNIVAEYEVFTQLTADKPVYLSYGETEGKTDGYLTFSTAVVETISDLANEFVVPSTGFTVGTDGLYRIRVNFTNKKVLVQAVTDYFIRCFGRKGSTGSWSNEDVKITYIGNGVFQIKDFEIKWGGDSWAARNDRYRLSIMYGAPTQQYGSLELNEDINPTKETVGTYWAIQLNSGGNTVAKGAYRWPAWLIDENKNPAYTADVTFYMNYDKGEYYYHTFTNEKPVE